MAIDKRIIAAGAVAGAVLTLAAFAKTSVKTGVEWIGGPGSPYVAHLDYVQVAQTVNKINGAQPSIVSSLVQHDARECDDKSEILRLEAKVFKSGILSQKADANDRECENLHRSADKATQSLLNPK